MAAFASLSEKLNHIFSKMTKRGRLTELEIKQAMREVRIALLEADVNINVVKQFTAAVSEKAVGQEILKSLSPTQQVIKIVNEELISLMGEKNVKLEVAPKPPTVIMMAGLQGAGKTTLCGKLALSLKKQGKKPLLVACDVYRPAAINQLRVVGEKAGCEVFEQGQGNPVKIAAAGVKHARSYGFDTVIIDTAGRLHNKDNLMKELAKLRKIIDREAPNAAKETLLVLDATTGQNGLIQARQFKETAGLTGIILTKLDGTAKGGIVIAIAQELQVPVKFVGLGEGIDDLRPFDAREFVNDLI